MARRHQHHQHLWVAAVALVLPLAATAGCSKADLSTQGDSPSQAEHGTGGTNQGPSRGDTRVNADARNMELTLTGCVQQQPSGEFVLTGLENAGAGRATNSSGSQPDRSAGTSPVTSDSGGMTLPNDAAGLDNAYRLEPSGGHEDLSKYVGQRVTVVGQLASNAPSGKSPDDVDRAAIPGTGPRFGESQSGRGIGEIGGQPHAAGGTEQSQGSQQPQHGQQPGASGQRMDRVTDLIPTHRPAARRLPRRSG